MDQFAFQFEIAQDAFQQAVETTPLDELYGCFQGDQLLAKLALFRMETYVNRQKVKMGGIAGVATWPEHRRGGRVARLLRHAFTVMRSEGLLVSHLTPFAFSFYRKYGYEHTIDRKQYTIERVDWPKWKLDTGHIERVQDFRLIAPMYETFAARYSGTLARSESWWNHRIRRSKPGTMAVYFDDAGDPTGYMIYQVKSNDMTIHEFVYLNEAARRGLWGFIGQHDSMAKKVTFVAPVDDPLPFLLPNPTIKQEIVPHFMTRIVDVEPFLQQFSFNPTEAQAMVIQITDPDAPWNEGAFLLELSEQGGPPKRVSRVASDGGNANHAVLCDIQTLTSLFFGYQSANLLASIGRLTGWDRTILDLGQSVPKMTTFLYDSF